MPQTFSQNGHTPRLMWTFQSSWPSKIPHFLVVDGNITYTLKL
jgi:hypothetical protein